MKNIFFYSILVLAPIFFVSCNGEKELVRETGEKFIDAMVEGDLEKVKAMVTPETYDRWGSATNILEVVMTPEIKENLQSVETRVIDVKVNGKEAQAILAVSIPMESGETFTLHFKKAGRAWLVHEPNIFIKKIYKEQEVIMDVDTLEKQ